MPYGQVISRSGADAFVIKNRRRNRHIRYYGFPLPEIPAKMNAAVFTGIKEAIKQWQREVAPRHFTVSAYDMYGGKEKDVYKERRGQGRRKDGTPYETKAGVQVVGGRVVPLQRSKRLKERFLNSHFSLISAGSGHRIRVTARFTGLPFYTFPYDSASPQLQHNKTAELTIMSESEKRDLARNIERYVKKEFEKN